MGHRQRTDPDEKPANTLGLSGFVEIMEPRGLKEAVAAQAREILEQLNFGPQRMNNPR